MTSRVENVLKTHHLPVMFLFPEHIFFPPKSPLPSWDGLGAIAQSKVTVFGHIVTNVEQHFFLLQF